MAKVSSSKPKTADIVLSALKKLMKNTGWTPRTIIKFIKLEYRISDPSMSRKVSRALKRGARMGLYQSENGRYRLSDMAVLSKGVSYRNIHTQKQKKRNCTCNIRRRNPQHHDYRSK